MPPNANNHPQKMPEEEPPTSSLTPITQLSRNPGILDRAWKLSKATILIKRPDDSFTTLTIQHIANIKKACDFLHFNVIPLYLPTNFHDDVALLNHNTPDGFGLPSFDPVLNEVIPFDGTYLTYHHLGLNYDDTGFRPRIERGTIQVHGDRKGAAIVSRALLEKTKAAFEYEDRNPRGSKRRRGDDDEDYDGGYDGGYSPAPSGSYTPGQGPYAT